MRILQLKIGQIRAERDMQPRVEIAQEAVENIAAGLLSGEAYPAITVFWDGESYWLADGWHRWLGHKAAEMRTIVAEVREGTRREALVYACGANVMNPSRFTNADKRRAVLLCLAEAEAAGWSNYQIADFCRVDEKSVRNYRRQLEEEAAGEEAGDRGHRSGVRGEGSGEGKGRGSSARGGGGRERIERTCEHLRAAWEVGRGLVDVADELEHQINRAVQIAQSSTEE